MFATAEFWVFIAFLLLIAGFGKKAFGFLNQTLDTYRQKITQDIESAQNLHDEAVSLLNSYKKKHEEAIKQAEEIMSYAENEALEFKKASEQEFERFITQKENALLERISIKNEEAKLKLRKEAIDEAILIVEHVLSKDKGQKKKINTSSLKEISDYFH